jgi:hypothetical protein
MQKISKLLCSVLVLTLSLVFLIPNSQAEDMASDINSQDSAHVMVGVLDSPYPYDQKSHLLVVVKDCFQFFKQVVENWKDCISTDAKDYPEELEYCKAALPLVEEKFAKLKDAYSNANASNESEWTKNESELKSALRAAYLTYKNQNRRIPGAN